MKADVAYRLIRHCIETTDILEKMMWKWIFSIVWWTI